MSYGGLDLKRIGAEFRLQETLGNTFEINNPILRTIIKFGTFSTGLYEVSGLNGSNFGGRGVLQGFLVKSASKHLC